MYQLFEVAGIELEYMIVDADNLKVCPISDKVLFSKSDHKSDVYNGEIDWSNELVAHVLEIKTHKPAKDLTGIHRLFYENVLEINRILQPHRAMLLPTGAHPTMNPDLETVIWPHEHNEIYALYNTIFGCKGHGWSNLQSMHINLPFAGDEQFGKLHAAIRVLLPLIPTLCASTPLIDGKPTGYADTRLEYYRKNQAKIPSIAGKVIPEQVFSKEDYYRKIFDPITADIRPYDKAGVLEHHFLNSRGAIARFDRGAIEIRLIDLQEAPIADLAIAEFFIDILKRLCFETWTDMDALQAMHENELSDLLIQAIKEGDKLLINKPEYLACFGIQSASCSAPQLWEKLLASSSISAESAEAIAKIIAHGTLSSRIIRKINGQYEPHRIHALYRNLAECLAENRMFV